MGLQRSHILETETFKDTFGPKSQRKKPRLDVGTFEELGKASEAAADEAESSNVDGESGMPSPDSPSWPFPDPVQVLLHRALLPTTSRPMQITLSPSMPRERPVASTESYTKLSTPQT